MCLVVFRMGKCRLELNLRCLEKSMENEYEVECGLQLVWFWRSDIFDNIDDIKKIDFVCEFKAFYEDPLKGFLCLTPNPQHQGSSAGNSWMLKLKPGDVVPDRLQIFSYFQLSWYMKPWGIHGWIVVWYPFLVAGTAHDRSFRGSDGQTPLVSFWVAQGCQQGKDQVWLPTDPKWGLTCSITRLWILNKYHHLICTHLYAWCSCCESIEPSK